MPVTYPPPVVTGGLEPTSVVCQPASGAALPLGQTTVRCTARDAAAQVASCAFSVDLIEPVPVSRATRLMAFGDSLTAGEVQVSAETRITVVDPTVAYPTVVRDALGARYAGQEITMSNQGRPGESAVAGTERISGVLEAVRPQVLLLLQGVIDLSEAGPSKISAIVAALKFDIRDARRRGVEYVFVSTLLPQKPGIRAHALEYIVPANEEIRQLVQEEGVYLLDGYAVLAGHEATLVGADGLHLTAEGYRVLGTAFAGELITVLDVPAGLSGPGIGRSLRRPDIKIRPPAQRPAVGFHNR